VSYTYVVLVCHIRVLY